MKGPLTMKNATIRNPRTPKGAHVNYEQLISLSGANIRPMAEGETLLQIERRLQDAVHGFENLVGAADRLKPYIGHLMLEVRERSLWQGNYKNFTDWYQRKVIDDMKFKRSYVLDALKIAIAFPSFTAAQISQYGITKLLEAAKVTDESKPDAKGLLTESLTMSIPEFKDRVRELRGLEARETTPTITIRVDQEIRDWWDARLAELGIMPADLFLAMRDAWITHRARPHPSPPAASGRRTRAVAA